MEVAICPSVSCQGPELLLGPGNPVVTKTDKLPAFVEGPLPTKVCLVKAIVFPVVMYGCESWTIRKLSAEELMILNCGVAQDS